MRQVVHLLSMVGLIAAALCPAGCKQTPSATEAFFSEATVERDTIADVVLMAGQVAATRSQHLTMGTVGGRVLEILAHTGQGVDEGQVLLRLETADLERKLREAEADLTVAAAIVAVAERQAGTADLALAKAQLSSANYETLRAGFNLAVAEAGALQSLRAGVTDARHALTIAEDQLKLTELTSQQSLIRSLEYDQAFHERTLRDLPLGSSDRPLVERLLTEVHRRMEDARGQRAAALQAARDEVDASRRKLRQAEIELARAESGEHDPAISLRLALRQAEAAQEAAQRKVSDLESGLASEELQAAQAAHAAARLTVDTAQMAISAAELKAPFKGTLLAVYTGPGATVQPTDRLFFLADLAELHIQAEVSEIDIPKIAVGQATRISFDALPGKLYSGRVLMLPLQGRGQGGLSFYQVEVSLEAEQADVRLGMLSNVRVVVGERYGVLTVPAAALTYRSAEDIRVRVKSAGGEITEHPVEIGLNDGILAEVLSGLEEGQTVLLPLVAQAQPIGPRPYY